MSEAARILPEELWAGRDEIEVVTFDIAGEVFALEAAAVQEILDLLPETSVPGAKAFVGSVINFRGKVIPLADIRLAFGMEATKPTIDSRIIVIELEIEGEPTLTGIRTD
jgi:purine-binding chemotaxis protein CheW